MELVKEVCVGNYIEAIKGFENGANRIELCDNLQEGGTTPSYGTIKMTMEKVNIPVNVIIRPRGGDFVYSKEEIEIMKSDINICKELGVNGIVIGVLDRNNQIDINVMEELLRFKGNLEVTYHMAFDEIENKNEAIDQLADLGVNRILTKGGHISAINNIEKLKDLVSYGGSKIVIMPGGGVNKNNKEEVAKSTGAIEVHGTKIV